MKTDPIFGLTVPTAIEGVPADVLDPRGTWTDAAAYDAQAKKLAEMFRENIEKFGAGAGRDRGGAEVEGRGRQDAGRFRRTA